MVLLYEETKVYTRETSRRLRQFYERLEGILWYVSTDPKVYPFDFHLIWSQTIHKSKLKLGELDRNDRVAVEKKSNLFLVI